MLPLFKNFWDTLVKYAPVKQKTDRFHPDEISAAEISLGKRGKLRCSLEFNPSTIVPNYGAGRAGLSSAKNLTGQGSYEDHPG